MLYNLSFLCNFVHNEFQYSINMKNIERILCASALLLLPLGSIAQEWPELTQTAKPAARWWWLGSAVDENNLSYNMEEYAHAGLGELEITPIYGVQNNEENELSFLTPEWMKALEYTINKGKEVGMRIDMSTGTGWPFGGPETSIEDAATKAIFEQYTIEGGKAVELPIAVSNKKDASTSTLHKVMAYQGNKHIDVTKKCDEKGVLRWQAPEGEWQVIALFVGKTRQAVKRAAPGGEGYVRACYAASMKNLAEALTRLGHFLDRLKEEQGKE